MPLSQRTPPTNVLRAVAGDLLSLYHRDCVLDTRQRLGVDRLLVRLWDKAVENVRDEAVEHRCVGNEELRLVVVAHERQSTLQHAPIVNMGNLRREVVALDAVGVIQEVERVVDRQAEPRAPCHEPLVDLGGDANLGDLVEDVGRDGEQADERRPGTRAEHHLEAPLEGEDFRVKARAGYDVGEQVLDVVEHAAVAESVSEVEDLLLEQELFFVIEHARSVAPAGPGSAGPAPPRYGHESNSFRPSGTTARMKPPGVSTGRLKLSETALAYG